MNPPTLNYFNQPLKPNNYGIEERHARHLAKPPA